MKKFGKILIGILISIIVLGLSLGILYAYEKKEHKENYERAWNERFDKCQNEIETKIELFEEGFESTNDESFQEELENINTCQEKGGCYTCKPCLGSSELTFKKFLLELINLDSSIGCFTVCDYFCMQAIDKN